MRLPDQHEKSEGRAVNPGDKRVNLSTPAMLAVRTCVRERYIEQYKYQERNSAQPAFLLDDTLTLASEIGCTVDDVVEWHHTATWSPA